MTDNIKYRREPLSFPQQQMRRNIFNIKYIVAYTLYNFTYHTPGLPLWANTTLYKDIYACHAIIRFTWYVYKTCLEPQLPNTIDTNSEIQMNVPVII